MHVRNFDILTTNDGMYNAQSTLHGCRGHWYVYQRTLVLAVYRQDVWHQLSDSIGSSVKYSDPANVPDSLCL